MSGSSQIRTGFSGISDTGANPPHNGLAAGPGNVVTMEGSQIEWTDLAGGSPTQQSIYSFFSPLAPTGGLFDGRCVYDSVNQRYVVTMQYLASNATVSSIDVAVSKDSNPNDGWYFASLNTSLTINGQLTASDRPMVSVDGASIYITAPQYNVNVSGYAGTETWVIGDTAGAGGGIYNGGALTVTANQLTPPNQGIFTQAAGNNGKTYYACDYSNGSQIVVTLQVYDKATNTFAPPSTIGLGNIDQGGDYTAQQLGTTLLLDAGDKRIANLAYANGFLWGVAEEKPIGSSVPLVHWFELNVNNPNNPTLVAQGDISGAAIGANVATFNPSLAVDAAGDVLINFTASGPNMDPGDYYVFQTAGAPSGSFSAPVPYQASTGFFDSGDGASVQRWGLNSSAVVDPNNPNSFWISNEYVANGWWQTAVAQVAMPTHPDAPALTTASTLLNLPAGSSVPLGISVTPAHPGDNVAVTISGLATYETITDNLDGITFSGSANTLSAAQVNSGLMLNSTYTGPGKPVNVLTVTASITTQGGTASAAPQSITVTDPPLTALTSASDAATPTKAATLTPDPAPSGQAAAPFNRFVALLDQFGAAGVDAAPRTLGFMTNTVLASAGLEDRPFLSNPHH